MFQNMDMVSNVYDTLPASSAHVGGETHMLTAADRVTAEASGGLSIDQVIAQELNKDGLLTRLASLQVAAREDSEVFKDVWYHHSYAVPGEKLPYVAHIPKIWEYIFPEPLPDDLEEQNREINKKKLVYDFVKSDYDRLVQQLPAGDKSKIEAMLQSRTNLQKSLELFNDRGANRPPESILDPWRTLNEGYQLGSPDNPLWDTKVDIINQLVAAALHTDTTRVVNYLIELPPEYQAGYVGGTTYGDVQTTDWHDLAHKVSGDMPQITDPAGQDAMFAFEKACYDKLAALLAHLDSLPETDGGTLLDHTLVVVHSHIAEGSHDLTRLPWLLIGDAHGALTTGHYVRFPITHLENVNQIGQLTYPDDFSHRIYTYRGRPHNDFLLTVAHAMGVKLESFGRSMPENKGVISQILTA